MGSVRRGGAGALNQPAHLADSICYRQQLMIISGSRCAPATRALTFDPRVTGSLFDPSPIVRHIVTSASSVDCGATLRIATNKRSAMWRQQKRLKTAVANIIPTNHVRRRVRVRVRVRDRGLLVRVRVRVRVRVNMQLFQQSNVRQCHAQWSV